MWYLLLQCGYKTSYQNNNILALDLNLMDVQLCLTKIRSWFINHTFYGHYIYICNLQASISFHLCLCIYVLCLYELRMYLLYTRMYVCLCGTLQCIFPHFPPFELTLYIQLVVATKYSSHYLKKEPEKWIQKENWSVKSLKDLVSKVYFFAPLLW